MDGPAKTKTAFGRRLAGLLLVAVLAACQPPPVPPAPTATASATAPAAFTGAAPTAGSTPPAPTTPTAGATVTAAGPRALTVCLAGAPQSLYRYARPEPGREHILAALYDGPIDTANAGFQPVLFEHLPSLAGGEAALRATAVLSGETVVDALGRVQPLAPGLPVRAADGYGRGVFSGGSQDQPQLVVTFTLRSGLRWSDGAPLTADDSVFSFQVARSADSFDPQRDAGDRTESYRAIDDRTVVWTGLPGYVDPLYATRFWPPLPRHQLGSLTAAQIAASDLAARTPLGWGPFTLSAWPPGQPLVVQRNPHYWRAAEGLPWLDQVTYRFVTTAADLAAGLRDGTCDIAPSGPAMDQAAGLLAAGAQAGAVHLQTVPGTVLEHLDFDLAPATDYTGTAQTAPLQDQRTRQAIAQCLDRPALAPGGPAGAALPPLLASSLTQYPFDPSRWRFLLDTSYWRNTTGSTLLDTNGVRLTLTLAGDAAHQPLLQAIQSQLQKNCGLRVQLQTLTQSELRGDWPEGVVFGRRFELAVFAWQVGALAPCELFTTGEMASAANPGGANDTGYSNPEFDQACQRAVFPLDRPADAAALASAQNQLVQDLPMLPLFLEPRPGAARAGVRGYALDATSPSELWNLEVIQSAGK